MSYQLEISKKLQRVFSKIKKKNKLLSEALKKKIKNILSDPYQFKPLKGNMAGIRRVHLGKSFVLIYEILENEKIVRLLDFDHHNKIYK